MTAWHNTVTWVENHPHHPIAEHLRQVVRSLRTPGPAAELHRVLGRLPSPFLSWALTMLTSYGPLHQQLEEQQLIQRILKDAP